MTEEERGRAMGLTIQATPASAPPTNVPAATGVIPPEHLPLFTEPNERVPDPVRGEIRDLNQDLGGLTADDPRPVPAQRFHKGEKVRHLGSGEEGIVIGPILFCENPEHQIAHLKGDRPDRPDCFQVPTGDYVVGWGSIGHTHVNEIELELVPVVPPPPVP